MGYSTIPPLAYTSILKFTIDGRPSIEDIHDLFSTLISQVSFSTHRYMFRNYSNTFTSEDAIQELGTLKFTKSFESAEYKNEAISTTTTFQMSRDMAKALIQQFLWTRLIVNAVEPSNRAYRDKGLWRLSSKGLCVLQEFCVKTKMDIGKFATYVDPSARLIFLIQVERLRDNDRLNNKRKYISCLFAIMIASLPLRHNYSNESKTTFEDAHSIYSSDSGSTNSASRNVTFSDYFPHIKTMPNDLLVGVSYKYPQWSNQKSSFQQQKALLQNLNPSSKKFKMRAIFTSLLCCNWLIEFCTVASNDEAESIMTEFLNLGWIAFYEEKYRHSEYIESSKSITLNMTREGIKVVMDHQKSKAPLLPLLQTASNGSSGYSSTTSTPLYDNNTIPYFDIKHPSSNTHHKYYSTPPPTPTTPTDAFNPKEGNFIRLKMVLKDAHFRSLFRDFLECNYCTENLDFWIDYDSLRRKCRRHPGQSTANQKQLLEEAYGLWETYLMPGTTHCELNIDHALRQDMAEDISNMVTLVETFTPGQSRPMVIISTHSTAQSLSTILNWFDKVIDQVCRMMASDSIPKFIRTPEYKKAVYRLKPPEGTTVTTTAAHCNKSSIVTIHDLDDFPPPPQRKIKEPSYFF
ncbi:regulator of G protein signaling domain-containing protein [Mucor lusitanicus]|uniref:Regulator of G protein signaling domain-containing protein n=1 Tax=Mucor circinelloides f. lusitanicus TaxID=29924 RepID=A0A8H4BMP9_MUCCL|nr:regulator of G protein signaling domain-containing protein [Mucor lusitanicus]